MVEFWAWIVLAGSAVVGVCLAYRWILAIAYLIGGRRLTAPLPAARERCFAVVVPAHDEEGQIAETIQSIQSCDYPADRVRVVVVADNCTDRTAELARAEGAEVYERSHATDRGKGFALAWVFDQLALEDVDAVAVIDADCIVGTTLLQCCNREFERGARVLQTYDGPANPDETMLTRLIAVTAVMKNLLWSGGKCVLGLSPPLMGTGMVFSVDVLREVPWTAFSISEDVEHTFNLLEAGETVRFVPDAHVYAQEASTLGPAFSQRQRWAVGRTTLRRRAWQAVGDGVRQLNLKLFDAGLSVLMPTYSMLMNWTLVVGLASIPLLASRPWVPFVLAGFVVLQLAEFALGLVLLRADRRFVQAVLLAPVFLVWKALIDLLAALGLGRREWTRTERNE